MQPKPRPIQRFAEAASKCSAEVSEDLPSMQEEKLIN